MRTIENLPEVLSKHKKWLLSEAGGEKANLQKANLLGANLLGANLQKANLLGANLREADLRGANLDYSCWPLWCGSFEVKVDMRIVAQLAYHFCRLACDDPEYIVARNALLPIVNQFHRVSECGRLKGICIQSTEKEGNTE